MACSRSAISAAIAAASDGDTICVQAGTATDWTTPLTITKGIHLKALGTITRDGNGRAIDCACIIQNDSSGRLMSIELAGGYTTRITGFKFIDGTGTFTPLIEVTGLNTDSRRLRIDSCVADSLGNFSGPSIVCSFIIVNTVLGVMHRCTVLAVNQGGVGYSKNFGWNNGTLGANDFGDGAWADDDLFGTENFFFFEDNNFTVSDNGTNHLTIIDAQAGGRYVCRYNAITRGSLEGHGLEASRERSTRAVEVYNNIFTGADYGQIVTYYRGGVGVIHNNTMTGYQGSHALKLLHNRRTFAVTPWGGADGANQWDVNAANPGVSGTVTSHSALTLNDNTKSWTPSQWKGYAIRRTTNLGALSGEAFAYITDNDADTLNYAASAVGTDMQLTDGDSYEIRKVTHGMDMCGRSKGSNVGGAVTPSLPGGWNDQVTSPWYEWNNTREGGADVDFEPDNLHLVENTHFVNDTAKPGYTPYTYPHPLTLVP